MKKFGLIIGVCLLLMSCSTQENTQDDIESTQSLNMSEVLYKISEAATFETTFVVERDYLAEKYDYALDESIEVMGLFGSALDTNRVLLFKVVTKTDKANVLTYLSDFQDLIKASYPETMVTEKAMIDQAVILDSGSYVLFITGTGAQKGSNYFDELN